MIHHSFDFHVRVAEMWRRQDQIRSPARMQGNKRGRRFYNSLLSRARDEVPQNNALSQALTSRTSANASALAGVTPAWRGGLAPTWP
uniref:Uncharacterized protein n=1 Tax=Tetraselmis sp. GSL018 TaxID=582737 RepID=A0A061RPI2_9CHLO